MILVRANNTIINMDNIQGISLTDNMIIFDLPEGQAFTETFDTEEAAKESFEKLFEDLAGTPGVDGAVLYGDFV